VAFLVTDDEDPDDIRQDQDFLGGPLIGSGIRFPGFTTGFDLLGEKNLQFYANKVVNLSVIQHTVLLEKNPAATLFGP
jgi:hypothetical protein